MAIFVTDAVFLFLSMKDYKDSMSSSCLECSFWKDIFVFLLNRNGCFGYTTDDLILNSEKKGVFVWADFDFSIIHILQY